VRRWFGRRVFAPAVALAVLPVGNRRARNREKIRRMIGPAALSVKHVTAVLKPRPAPIPATRSWRRCASSLTRSSAKPKPQIEAARFGYYTALVYERNSPSSQDEEGSRLGATLARSPGGRRYDDLVKRLHGQEVPATGFLSAVDVLWLPCIAKGAGMARSEGPRLWVTT